MFRSVFAAAMALTPLLASAAEPTKPSGRIEMLIATIDGDKLTSTAVSPVTKSVTFIDKDGNTKAISVTETITTTTARELKFLKATDTDGKEIPVADLKTRLKNGGLVVFLTGPLDPDWRKKFKSGVVFVEYTAPKEEKSEEKK
jgi:hypothetical protein